MSVDTAYTELMEFQRQTEALAQVMGRLSWDQETVMPRGATCASSASTHFQVWSQGS